MKQKRVFSTIFLLLVILLMTLPFLVTFDELLTRIVERIGAYMFIQKLIVPYEIRLVSVIIALFGIHFQAYENGMLIHGVFLEMTWNCIGWQSIFMLGISLVVGLRSGSYTKFSVLKTILLGILGTFWVNLIRLSFIVLLFSYARPLYAIVYHNYLAALVIVLWLFVYWWFAYSFVLDVKEKPGNEVLQSTTS